MTCAVQFLFLLFRNNREGAPGIYLAINALAFTRSAFATNRDKKFSIFLPIRDYNHVCNHVFEER
jgi:hypothetical protein